VVDTILQDCWADRNSVNDEGRTALWWAAHEGQITVVRQLLEDANIYVDIRDYQGADALEAVQRQYYFNVISLL
jgi:ankyrin repeat protein